MSRIGFIGLGIMGMPMSQNLHKAGYQVMVYNRSEGPMKAAAEAGLIPAATAEELAESCDVVITMLPNSPDVRMLLLGGEGTGGIANTMKPGTLVIDMTSGDPTDSKAIYAALKERDVHFLDAPVSGGQPMAIAGTLAIMVGGDREVFESAKPLLLAMGKSATWVGPAGSGNTCKLTNQVIVAGNIAALAEGLMLAKKCGADTQLVFEAIKGGLAGSNVMNAKAPMMLADNYQPGFRIDLHIKDLTNAVNAGGPLGAPLGLTGELLAVMKEISVDGNGSYDHSGIASYYEKLAGIRFTE